MGILNSLRNITRWFTDKTGITRPNKESLKRKNDECENISNNKKMRMDDSLVEVVGDEIDDESHSKGEEAEIIEPGPSDEPLRANPPVILDGSLNQRQIMSPMDLTESSDEENKIKVVESSSLSNQPYLNGTASKITSNSFEDKPALTSSIKGTRNLSLRMERGFSALKINGPSVENSKEKMLAQIIKHLLLPKVETIETSIPILRSTLNIQNDHDLNQSNLPQTSDKQNPGISELSLHTNRTIKRELFHDRIFRKFRETQAAVALATPKVQHKSPDKIFFEKLEIMNAPLRKIKLPSKLAVFPGCSDDKIDFVKCQMRRPQNECITKGQNILISDLKTLFSPKAWLNDEVINHYLNMIVERDPDSIHMFSTFFYFKLSTQGYKSVSRWSRRRDIFKCRKIFIPIHMGNHWCLVCVNFWARTIKYYDSLGGTNPKCLNLIFDYLKQEHQNKKNEKFNCNGWGLFHASDCPSQKNSYDCGVFVCINAEYLARDSKLNFIQSDIPKLRLRMCYEILKNKLCY